MAVPRTEIGVEQQTAPSWAQTIGDLIGDLQRLIRQEVALVRSDFALAMARQKKIILLYTLSGVASLLGVGFISLGAILVLYEVLELAMWQSFLAISAIYLILAGIFYASTRTEKKEWIDGKLNSRPGEKELGNPFLHRGPVGDR